MDEGKIFFVCVYTLILIAGVAVIVATSVHESKVKSVYQRDFNSKCFEQTHNDSCWSVK